jgi:competence protein ComEC
LPLGLAAATQPGTFRRVVLTGPGWAADCLAREAEARRLFPWIAVAYGGGIALAFAADGPLSIWPPLVTGTLLVGVAALCRARPLALAVLIALTAVFFGFAAAVLRTTMAATPVLGRVLSTNLEGFVEAVEERPVGGRMLVRVTKLDKVAEVERPMRVRVSARALEGLAPGDYVAGTARLLPPPEAARPGGYDFARDAYFRGIGAVGSVSGKLRRIEPAPVPQPWDVGLAAAVDRARNALTSRIATAIGGQAGAVAAALVTGKRGLIEESTNDVLRAAGIYHIVSISGLHMMLAAGVFFWLARAILALSPALALNWPIKKIAALVGMAGATAYCVFSGSDVAAERSLLMILVMQGAILIDRPALSMRNLAISALLVLTREPEALLGPSLQMSYAAVAGLIALAEWSRGRHRGDEATDPIGRALAWAGALALATIATTLVATLATAPFSGFHFQNLQPYGLLGNAATLPLVSFVVMPCAVLGTLAFPFGLDRPVWWLMGLGVQLVLKLSEWVASLGGSIVTVPGFGAGALLLLVLALLWATLFVSGLRWLALAPAALGLAAAWSTPRQDIYVARDGSGAAIRGREGRLVVVGRVPAFTAEQWLKADGDARNASDPTVRAGSRCDPIGCIVPLPDGRAVSYLEDRRGFAEDCRRAAIIISRLTAPKGCAASFVVDRAYLTGHGATAIRAAEGGRDVTTARRPDETRPWLPKPSPGASAAPPARAGPLQTQRPRAEMPAEPFAEPELPPTEVPDGDSGP